MAENTDNRIRKLVSPLSAVISGYAQVFFSTNPYVGLIFLAATFIIPAQGSAGLFSLLLSNYWAMLLGLSRDHIKQGYFAYNGLLTGLALGLIYEVNTVFFIMLFIATLLGVLIAASLRSIFERYLFIPVLSTPFVLTAWITITAGRQFQGLIYTLEPYEFAVFTGMLPSYVELFVRSLGATFFQLSIVSGIIVAIGLLVFSRHAFLLAITGLASGSIIYLLLKGNPLMLTTELIGFNFALTAIAVGGIWMVPSIDSFLLATAGGAICAVLAAASTFFLKTMELPVLAFPFVTTTSFIIYALKNRGIVSRLMTVAIPEVTPEKNLKRHKNARARFVTGEIPVFDLPVSGKWRITQGFNGELTHKDLWMHAWDFEVYDEEEMNCRSGGSILENFYSYNMPVFAPAAGKVVTIVNHIEDNRIGQVNTENNWGNVVIIWHYGNIYTALCHLKMGSINVNEGDVVRYGQMIAKVGNSGRSPVPHLHFQVQTSHEIGAPTIPSELMHYITIKDGQSFYNTHGCPGKMDWISPLQAESSVFDTVGFPQGFSRTFNVQCLGKAWREKWETEIDFIGNRYIVCRQQKARIRFFANRKVLLLLDYEGRRNIALFWLFMSVPRLPMTTANVSWKDELPGELIISMPRRILFDFAEPVFSMVKLSSSSKLIKAGKQLTVETVLNSTGPLAYSRYEKINAVTNFEMYKGLISLNAKVGDEIIFQLTRTEQRDGNKE